MKINYDFPWYLQNSEAFMTMYNGLYTVASNISPLPFLECLNIDELTYFEQLRTLTWIFGLFGNLVSVEDALIYDVNNWSGRQEVPADVGTQLDYITAPLTPTYLVTDIIPQPNYKIELEFLAPTEPIYTTVSTPICGAGATPTNTGIVCFAFDSDKFAFYGFNPQLYISDVSLNVGVRYKFVWDDNMIKLYANGVEVLSNVFTVTETNTSPFAINAIKDVGATSANHSTVINYYGLKIWDSGDNLIANYIPCKQNTTAGFYDTISGVFKTASSGNFIEGPEAPYTYEENYWSGNPVDDLSLLRNYIKAKVQIRNKNLTLQTIKQFFSTCLAHREFDADTDIRVTESTLHFDITVTVNQDILNDMASLYATDPYPFGKPVGVSYSINYVQE